MLPKLMDSVMDVLVCAFRERRERERERNYPPLETVTEVFSLAPRNSTMRRLMVEIFCYNIVDSNEYDSGGWRDEEIERALKNEELLEEVVRKVRGCCRGRGEDPLGVERDNDGEVKWCRWHVHEREIIPSYECRIERETVESLEREDIQLMRGLGCFR
jgi:hypothetical protein